MEHYTNKDRISHDTGKKHFITHRLFIEQLTINDTNFINELVNTAGWLKFIGNRNVNSLADAAAYIERIVENPDTVYWVTRLRNTLVPIGIITFIKRDYLDYHDIGFAFLPGYTKKGYAMEATAGVLNNLIPNYNGPYILATTNPDNEDSIRLLKKLGFHFDKNIEANNQVMDVYSRSTDKLQISVITQQFFNVFTNKDNKQPGVYRLREICIPEVLIINMLNSEERIYNLSSFIYSRNLVLGNGSLTEFEEHEVAEETRINGHMAHRFTWYEKSGILNGRSFKRQGYKVFQFIKTGLTWKISSVTWENDQAMKV